MNNAPQPSRSLPRFLTGLAIALAAVLGAHWLLGDPTAPGNGQSYRLGWFAVVAALILADLTEPGETSETRGDLVAVMLVFAAVVFLGVRL